MRRTIITLSRFTTSTTNWWANSRWTIPGRFAPAATLALAVLVLLSCEDDTGDVGFKNPNGDFQVFVKEFSIPSKTFLMDSIATSYGYMIPGDKSTETPAPHRFMAGAVEDPIFGKTTATAYTHFWASTFPTYGPNPTLGQLILTLKFDYYWSGDPNESNQTFEVYEMTDSLLTYLPHYANESHGIGRLLGTATKKIVPADFDKNIVTNRDDDTSNDFYDSINVTLDKSYAQELFNLAMDTLGNNESNYDLFYKFRQRFKGLVIKSPNSNKIIGFDIENNGTKMVLDYKLDTSKTVYTLNYLLTPSGQAVGTREFMSYTQLETDRSGTPLAGLSTKYQDFEAPTGLRYVQPGTGITTRLDFSEVADYFKNIPIKALSVAELRLETDEQKYAPYSFLLRAIKPNNREVSTSTQGTDITGDPYATVNYDLVAKHQFVSRADGGWGSPFYKAEVMGDDKLTFILAQASNSGTAVYTGYMTNYLQTELGLSDADFLRYYELIPYAVDKKSYAPDMGSSVNGFYFSPDKVTLKVYYTTPRVKE